MQVWKFGNGLELPKWSPTVLLSLEGKTRKAVLELNLITLNANDSMEKLYKKFYTLFLEEANQSAFIAYKSFESYWRQWYINRDLLINLYSWER